MTVLYIIFMKLPTLSTYSILSSSFNTATNVINLTAIYPNKNPRVQSNQNNTSLIFAKSIYLFRSSMNSPPRCRWCAFFKASWIFLPLLFLLKRSFSKQVSHLPGISFQDCNRLRWKRIFHSWVNLWYPTTPERAPFEEEDSAKSKTPRTFISSTYSSYMSCIQVKISESKILMQFFNAYYYLISCFLLLLQRLHWSPLGFQSPYVLK